MPITREERSVEDGDLQVEGETALEVLRTIADDNVTASFQGLKRRTRFHQESLSRALNRLLDDGLIAKSGDGYSLTENGQSVAHRWLNPPSAPRAIIMQSYLPQDLSPNAIIQGLAGRWFTNLRWLGMREEIDGATLKWITDKRGVEIVVRVRLCQVTVESDASDPAAMEEAFFAAQKLLSSIKKRRNDGRLCCMFVPSYANAS